MVKFLTPTELAEELNVDPETLSRWRASGKGPRFVKLSPGRTGAIRYRREAVDEWIASKERRSTAEVAA